MRTKDKNIFADRSTDFLHRFKATLISIIGEVEVEISRRMIQEQGTGTGNLPKKRK